MTQLSLNFELIRPHNGTQTGGFEELICQLAHLEPLPDASMFVSKEGSGGDAGVECFWMLSDQTEHGWQAKYFTKTLTSFSMVRRLKTMSQKMFAATKFILTEEPDSVDCLR